MAPGSSSGTEKVKASNDYIAGVAAGVATVLIGHPFDTIKVKLQTQRRNAQASQYRNGVHCLMQIVRGEGARGLYRGATPSFVGMSLESALLFGIYTQLRSTFQAGDEKSPLLYSVLPAGFLAGASVSTVLCPTELVKASPRSVSNSSEIEASFYCVETVCFNVKRWVVPEAQSIPFVFLFQCRLQAQVKRGSAGGRSLKVYDGPVDCVLRTLRSEGVQGLFRGLTATFAREAFGNSAFFLTYEFTRSHMLSRLGLQTNRVVKDRDEALVERGSTSSMYTNHLMEAGVGIASGGLAGIAFWLVVLPIDVAKTRIQISEESHQSRNPLVHLRAIHKDLGIRGLYAGLGPTLIRAFPANAASIVTWEVVSKFLAGNF